MLAWPFAEFDQEMVPKSLFPFSGNSVPRWDFFYLIFAGGIGKTPTCARLFRVEHTAFTVSASLAKGSPGNLEIGDFRFCGMTFSHPSP